MRRRERMGGSCLPLCLSVCLSVCLSLSLSLSLSLPLSLSLCLSVSLPVSLSLYSDVRCGGRASEHAVILLTRAASAQLQCLPRPSMAAHSRLALPSSRHKDTHTHTHTRQHGVTHNDTHTHNI